MFGYTIISTYRNLETLFIYSILATENIQNPLKKFGDRLPKFLKACEGMTYLSIYAHVILTFY
jgi:hypothetical protein